MIEMKVCLKLGSLSLSVRNLSEGVVDADPLLGFFVDLELEVSARVLDNFGQIYWKNLGMTGRQLIMMPADISA